MNQIQRQRMNQICNLHVKQLQPLENLTNFLNNVFNVLPQATTTTTTTATTSTTTTTTGGKRGPKPLPRDPVTGKIIRLLNPDGTAIAKHRKSKQTNKENSQ